MTTCGDRVLAFRSRGGGIGLILFALEGSPVIIISMRIVRILFCPADYDYFIIICSPDMISMKIIS